MYTLIFKKNILRISHITQNLVNSFVFNVQYFHDVNSTDWILFMIAFCRLKKTKCTENYVQQPYSVTGDKQIKHGLYQLQPYILHNCTFGDDGIKYYLVFSNMYCTLLGSTIVVGENKGIRKRVTQMPPTPAARLVADSTVW